MMNRAPESSLERRCREDPDCPTPQSEEVRPDHFEVPRVIRTLPSPTPSQIEVPFRPWSNQLPELGRHVVASSAVPVNIKRKARQVGRAQSPTSTRFNQRSLGGAGAPGRGNDNWVPCRSGGPHQPVGRFRRLRRELFEVRERLVTQVSPVASFPEG